MTCGKRFRNRSVYIWCCAYVDGVWFFMLELRVDGVELGVAVALLAVNWVFLSLFAYLAWHRFLKDKLVKLTSPMLKAAMIVAFALLVALLLFAVYFSQTHGSFEAAYGFPADFTYRYVAG